MYQNTDFGGPLDFQQRSACKDSLSPLQGTGTLRQWELCLRDVYIEQLGPCTCGRTLPTLYRVLGADGKKNCKEGEEEQY